MMHLALAFPLPADADNRPLLDDVIVSDVELVTRLPEEADIGRRLDVVK
jgi:hypothetical protein